MGPQGEGCSIFVRFKIILSVEHIVGSLINALLLHYWVTCTCAGKPDMIRKIPVIQKETI